MTNKEAISHLMNDWFVALSGQLTVDMDKTDSFIEAIGLAIEALYSQKNQQKCRTCKWLSNGSSCACKDSKYNGFLMSPLDNCDNWKQKINRRHKNE